MMTTLLINDVPDAWADALRQRAARNHRPLQAELMVILEAAIHAGIDEPQPGTRGLPEQAAKRRDGKTIEQIAQEHRQRFPAPISGGPLSVDIIREDRDSR